MAALMEGASQQTCAAPLPPDRFHCRLDDLPFHLIPRRAVRKLGLESRESFAGEPLYLNPECRLCSGGQVPPEMTARMDLLAGLANDGTIAWVRDQPDQTLRPFWLGPQFESIVRGLTAGEPILVGLDRDARLRLAAAGILVPADDFSRRQREQEEVVQTLSAGFRAKGYAPISGLIHPFHVAALRRYYRYLVRSGAIRLGDGQSARRYVAYNEPVARFFHHQIAKSFSALAGEPLKPSYVYLASYLSGAELRKHIDREQCEFSITLCLDFSPEPELETPWPIELDTPEGSVAVCQALGDGLAYRGTRLPHYRGVLGEGRTSTSIFFHYVPMDFAGPLD